MKTNNRRYLVYILIYFLLLLCCGLGFTMLFFPDLAADIQRTLPRLAVVSEVQKKFDDILQTVVDNTSDVLIEESEISPVSASRGRYFAGCIRGATEIVYGSTRNFNDVLEEYENLFTQEDGWTFNPGGSNFLTEKSNLALQLLSVSDSSYSTECENFPVCYSVRLYYADPSLQACSG